MLLGAILLVAAVLRVAYLGEITHSPDFIAPGVDAGFHDYWARGLATGDWTPPAGEADPQIRSRPFLRPPGYPYFLSLIYRLAGTGPTAPRLVQMGLGLLNVLLGFLVARRWFGRNVALILASFLALYWAFIYFEGELHAPALLIVLLWCLVYACGRWADDARPAYALAAGLLFGLSALVQPNVLLFVPVVSGWAWWVAWRQRRMRRLALALVLFFAGLAGTLAPAAVRNYRVSRDFVLISSNAGINLFIGNNPNADGLVAASIPGLGRFGTCYDYPALVRNLERQEGRSLTDSEVSACFARRAWRFICDHPASFLRLTARKALLFWGPREIGHNKEVHYERAFSPVLSHVPGNFSSVLALSVVGLVLLVLSGKRPPAHQGEPARPRGCWEVAVLILALVATYFLSVLPFFSAARYRVPVIPFLMLFAAVGVFHIGRFIAVRDLRRAGLSVVACAAAYLIAAMPFVEYQPSLDGWYYDRAIAFRETGDLHRAMETLGQALQLNPSNMHAHQVLGDLLLRTGDIDGAIRHHAAAVQIDPDSPPAHNELAHALRRAGRLDEAVMHWAEVLRLQPDAYEAHHNLANALADRGEINRAVEHYVEAIRLRPDYAPAHLALANLRVDLGQIDQAMEGYRRALAIDPGLAQAHNNLGRMLALKGETVEAVEHYHAALRLRPGYLAALRNLGAAYAELGRLDQAAEALRAALAIEPQDVDTGFSLAQMLHRSGRLNEAIAAYREVLQLDPAHGEARWGLQTALAEQE